MYMNMNMNMHAHMHMPAQCEWSGVIPSRLGRARRVRRAGMKRARPRSDGKERATATCRMGRLYLVG